MPTAVAARIRIAFLIRSLHRGGAERQLAELVGGLDPRVFDVRVLTFYPGGAIWQELAAHPNLQLESLYKRGRWDIVECTWRLTRVLRTWRADILHTYLVEPSIYGLMAGRLAGVKAIVWGIRASNVDYSRYGLVNQLTFKAAGQLSRFADLLVANSDSGRAHHVACGFANQQFIAIHNGIDTERYRRVDGGRALARAGWKVSDEALVIGASARLDPMKDHATALRALTKLASRFPRAILVCCGGGSETYLRSMRTLADELGISDRVIWVGEEPRMEIAYGGFDVLCSSSFGEGFSNSIAEAMACGVPCVVTDVGDSAEIVGDTGMVVPPRDSDALANALATLLVLTPDERAALGAKARARIVDKFGVATMVARTSDAYRTLISASRTNYSHETPEPDGIAAAGPNRPGQKIG